MNAPYQRDQLLQMWKPMHYVAKNSEYLVSSLLRKKALKANRLGDTRVISLPHKALRIHWIVRMQCHQVTFFWCILMMPRFCPQKVLAIPSAFKLSSVARKYRNIPFFCTLSQRDTLLLYTIIVKISENRQVCSLNQPRAFASNFDLRYERNFRSLGVAYSRRIRRAPIRLRAISVNSVPDLALTDRARIKN